MTAKAREQAGFQTAREQNAALSQRFQPQVLSGHPRQYRTRHRPARIRIDKLKSILHRKNISVRERIKFMTLTASGIGNIKTIIFPQYADVLEQMKCHLRPTSIGTT